MMKVVSLFIAMLLSSQFSLAQSPATADEMTFYQHVSWSPDSRQLATSAMKIPRAAWEKEKYGALKKSQYDVYRIALDGSQPHRVTERAENDLWATWWPGGNCLLFSSEQNGRLSFFFIKADGSKVQQMRDDGVASVNEASVSPDGKRLAFTVKEGSETHIYRSIDGISNRIKITSTGPNNWGPVWSPDGKKLLFYSDRLGSGRDQILVVNADGSDEKQLTNDTFNNIFPSWSPDGQRILFASNREGKGKEELFVMNADGSNVRRLMPGVRAFFGRWSPDGKKLAFIAGTFPDTQIYLANADGSQSVQLTK